MSDTAHKEKIAENEIASVLGRRGLLVAKPFFDQRGADLLAFLHICGGAKFCRIQCKYRQEQSSVEIPVHYVLGAFVCIVYVVPKVESTIGSPQHSLYCFFPDDISGWNKPRDKYVLSIPTFRTCKERFKTNMLDDANFERLLHLIRESTVQDEMGMLDFSNPNNSALLAII